MNARAKGAAMFGTSAFGSPTILSRRRLLERAGAGFGLIGLAGLLQGEGLLGGRGAGVNPMAAPSAALPRARQSG